MNIKGQLSTMLSILRTHQFSVSATMVLHSLLVAMLFSTVFAEQVRFDNYRVYSLRPANEAQLQYLRFLSDNPDGVNFWTSANHVNSTVDLMVPPHKIPEFQENMRALKMDNHVVIEDVQEAIYNERPIGRRSEGFDWNDYYTLDRIYEWLDSLVQQFPNIVTPIVGGSSYEGRQIKGVKISYNPGNPGVFIEGGIHAREWISPATVTYMLNQLLISTDPDVRDVAENYDWYIFPTVNPDGYEYTFTSNRMWRKTRAPSSPFCFGVDPNRNWDFHWNEKSVSMNPCSDIYAGSKAFSEVETRTMSQYIASVASNIQVFLSFHSYSQFLLIPYGHTNKHVYNYDTLMDIGTKAIKSLYKKYGTKYTVGNIVDILYAASGISADWVYHTFDIPITYTYELRDRGNYGFLLPADQIVPTGEETLASIVTIVQEARRVVSKP